MAGKDELAALFIRLGINDKEFRAGLKNIGKDIQGTEDHTNKLSKGLKAMQRIAVAAFAGWGIREVARAVIDTSLEVDRFHKRLNAAAGGGKATGEAMKFFKGEIDRLGLSMLDSQKGFSNLLAAARLSGVGFSDVKKVFTGISEASVAMQMSSDDTAGALRAVVQIMSKGKAQAEELRGQLGERLPGAFGLAAKAMGVTTQELSKMLDLGQVLAKDLLPKFGEELHKAFGKGAEENAKSFNQELQRMKTSWAEFVEALNKAGLNELLADITRAITKAMNLMKKGLDESNQAWINELKTTEEVMKKTVTFVGLREKLSKTSKANLQANLDYAKTQQIIFQLGKKFVELKIKEKAENDLIIDAQDTTLMQDIMLEESLGGQYEMSRAVSNEMGEQSKQIMKNVELREKLAAEEEKSWKILVKQGQEEEKHSNYIDKVIEDMQTVNDMRWFMGMEPVKFIDEDSLKRTKELLDDFGGEIKEWSDNFGTGLEGEVDGPFKKFFEGLSVDLKKSANEWNDWGKHLNTITKDFGSNLHGSLSDTFFSLVKGDLDSLSDIWRGFADGLLKSVTNVIADMAISWGAKALGGLLKFEEGAWEVKGGPDGTPSLLHPGEMVVPAEQADQLRDKWKNLESMNVGIDSISDTFGGDKIDNSTIASFMGGAAKGSFGQMAQLGAAGLFGPGAGMWGTILNSAPGGLLAGGISGGFSALLEDAGFLGGKGNIGMTAGGILGGIALGPAGSLMGGVIGQIAGELIGDLTGLRNDDALRDSIEEMGYGRGTSGEVSTTLGKVGMDLSLIPGFQDQIIGDILSNATPVDSISDIVGNFIDGLVEGIANPTSTYGQDWMTPGSGVDMPGTGVDLSPGLDFGGNTGWGGGWDGGWGGQGDDGGWGGGDDGGDGGWGGEGDDAGWRHGTGMEGLPETGSFTGHEGEIVMSPEESNLLRRGQGGGGGGGGNITVNVQIDGKTIATAVAKQAYRNGKLKQAIKDVARR